MKPKLGVSCTIGEHVVFELPVIIGNKVKIGSNTVFAGIDARSRLVRREISASKTIVEDGVVIGSNVTIVGNTTIKKGAVVADGSVVIGYVWSETFVAGNPARHIYSLSSIR